MTATVLPPSPSPSPLPSVQLSSDQRFVFVRATLMPDEVLTARRTESLRRQILFALAGLLALLVAWYAISWFQTHSANGDLSDANHRSALLHAEQAQYAPLVRAQAEAASIETQLVHLMVGDLQWQAMLTTLQKQARSDVTIAAVNASITTGAAAAGTVPAAGGLSIGVLNTSGKQAVGTLTITGTARDKNAVASYVDRLATVKGLATPYVASVSQDQTGHWLYTVQVVITTDALGGRFTVAARGGK
jgi:Tfp pilus assembly protein PilN